MWSTFIGFRKDLSLPIKRSRLVFLKDIQKLSERLPLFETNDHFT